MDRNLQKDHFVSKMGHFGPKNGHDTHIIKKIIISYPAIMQGMLQQNMADMDALN